MAGRTDGTEAERFRALRLLISGWALLGGAVLVAVVLVNTASIVGAALFTLNQGTLGGMLPDWLAHPVPGDGELTEMGVAIAVFCFLPWCQLTRSNVTADIFTSGASPRWIARFSLLGSLVALAFMGLLAWRNYAGLLDQFNYEYQTAVLQIPQWYAFLPVVVSLGLTALAALVTLVEDAAAA